MSLIMPRDVSRDISKRILNFLNTVDDPEELARIANQNADDHYDEKIYRNYLRIAQKIIERRRKIGDFSSIEELLNIARIGPATFSHFVQLFCNGKVLTSDKVEEERLKFKSLLLCNSNYFGNMESSPLQPVKIIRNNTKFEELVCLSSNPSLNYVVCIVLIKQEVGFIDTRFRKGTYEYIRLYADWEGRGNWESIGIEKFIVSDSPGPSPLAYAVSFNIIPPMSSLGASVKMRAILSWNVKPPAGNPDFVPVWGSVLESEIEIQPTNGDLNCKLLEPSGENILTGHIQTIEPAQHDVSQDLCSFKQLVALYKNSNIPERRFAYLNILELLEEPQLEQEYTTSILNMLESGSTLIEEILGIECNTNYEELVYIGFNQTESTLTGILKLKNNRGYCSTHCVNGSYEYLAFWLWNAVSQSWLYLGTTIIKVNDNVNLPPQDLYYAVSIPINTEWLLSQNNNESTTMKILAVLSWGVPPPLNPEWKPAWGNCLNTIINIASYPPIPAGIAYLKAVGEMEVNNFSRNIVLELCPCKTMYLPDNETSSHYLINIAGFITNSPNLLAGDSAYKYSVSVRRCIDEITGIWTPWQTLTNSFIVTKIKQDGIGIPVQYDELQSVDPTDNCYKYQVQKHVDQWMTVQGNLLAKWEVPRSAYGLWEIRLEAKKQDNSPLADHMYYCGRFLRHNQIRLRFINNDKDPNTESG